MLVQRYHAASAEARARPATADVARRPAAESSGSSWQSSASSLVRSSSPTSERASNQSLTSPVPSLVQRYRRRWHSPPSAAAHWVTENTAERAPWQDLESEEKMREQMGEELGAFLNFWKSSESKLTALFGHLPAQLDPALLRSTMGKIAAGLEISTGTMDRLCGLAGLQCDLLLDSGGGGRSNGTGWADRLVARDVFLARIRQFAECYPRPPPFSPRQRVVDGGWGLRCESALVECGLAGRDPADWEMLELSGWLEALDFGLQQTVSAGSPESTGGGGDDLDQSSGERVPYSDSDSVAELIWCGSEALCNALGLRWRASSGGGGPTPRNLRQRKLLEKTLEWLQVLAERTIDEHHRWAWLPG